MGRCFSQNANTQAKPAHTQTEAADTQSWLTEQMREVSFGLSKHKTHKMTTQHYPKITLLKIGVYYLQPEKVLLLAGDGNYTKVILLDGSILISTKTLATYEEVVKAVGFVRIHKSFIINKMHLKQVTKQYVVLTNYLTPIPVSRRRRRQLK